MPTVTPEVRVQGEEPIPVWAMRELQTAWMRVRGAMPAQWLWDRVLSADDRRRLGGDLEAAYARYGGAAGMWRHLRGVSNLRAVVDVASRVGFLDVQSAAALLRAVGEESYDPAEAVEAAIAAGGLVLEEVARQVHWEGNQVVIDWGAHTSWWWLMRELARTSKAGSSVDEYIFRGGSSEDPKYLTKLKSKMITAASFPVSLAKRLTPAGRNTYRLDLPPSRIRIFERGAGDSVREWTP